MAGDTDFLALYQDLGLRADCTPQDLKTAYRKRVGELRPDRSPHDAHALRALQHLNARYESAIAFERRHGRLPGTPVPATGAARSAAGAAAAPAPARQGRRTGLIAVAAALGALATWAWHDAGETRSSPPRAGLSASAVLPLPSTSMRSTISLGSPEDRVRAIHGEPVGGSDDRWEYGPSWVAFRCGVVVDWYSSPLRPLKVADANPAAADPRPLPKTCKD